MRRKIKKRRVKRRTTRRRTVRRKVQKRKPRKTIRRIKRKPKRIPFGGYTIDFSGQEATLENIFGQKPITPPQMTKLLWIFIKQRHLNK